MLIRYGISESNRVSKLKSFDETISKCDYLFVNLRDGGEFWRRFFGEIKINFVTNVWQFYWKKATFFSRDWKYDAIGCIPQAVL